MRYICILRGINVSGKNKIKMADLRERLSAWGLAEPRTYIQSGNLVFDSERTAAELEEGIRKALREWYAYEVPTIVRTAAEWEAVSAGNPFLENPDYPADKMHVTFLAREPDSEQTALFEKLGFEGEHFALKGKEVYLYLPKGYGRAKLNNNFIERKLKVPATTRNWKTLGKLLEMAGE